jgi:hypothetical protein
VVVSAIAYVADLVIDGGLQLEGVVLIDGDLAYEVFRGESHLLGRLSWLQRVLLLFSGRLLRLFPH